MITRRSSLIGSGALADDTSVRWTDAALTSFPDRPWEAKPSTYQVWLRIGRPGANYLRMREQDTMLEEQTAAPIISGGQYLSSRGVGPLVDRFSRRPEFAASGSLYPLAPTMLIAGGAVSGFRPGEVVG